MDDHKTLVILTYEKNNKPVSIYNPINLYIEEDSKENYYHPQARIGLFLNFIIII